MPIPLSEMDTGTTTPTCRLINSHRSHDRRKRLPYHRLVMEYFTLDTKNASGEPAVVDAALRRAWNACAAVACSKCGVPAWQYCRNSTGGTLLVTRFHRPRQDAAGAPKILAKVGIRELSWAKARGGNIKWDDRQVPTL